MRRTAIALTTLLSLLLAADAARAADKYAIDTVHSAIVFKVKHLGVSNARGRFNAFSGSVAIDYADLAKSSIEVEVKAESVDTGNAKRDQHVRNADFLNVKEFPSIRFASKTVKKAADGKYEVTGDLTLHGTTKSITVTVEKTGAGKGPGGDIVGYETTFTVRRSDHGMKGMIPAIGDDVEITVSIEAGKK
jgi:polyisoprenoid-binding protein YceI